MTNIIGDLYVGDDADYEKIKDRGDWRSLRCCKEGPGGHRDSLGYTTPGAPKDSPEYLAAMKRNRMALNMIDPDDPNLIPEAMVKEGLQYVQKKLAHGDKVLIACNAGHSRGPTTAMLYLRSIGELPSNFISSERVFRTLYPKYDPGLGVRQFARSHWDTFENLLNKDGNGS